LDKGNVEQVGTPLEIYDNPASLFVATFIGSPSMNILDANVSIEGIELDDARLNINTSSLVLGEIKLGLRPEHLTLNEDNPWFHVEVELIEALGADLLLYCKTVGSQSQKLVVRVEGHSKIAIGDKLGLDIDVEHIHLFDSDTSKRIHFDSKTQQQEVMNA
jgi:sn-glycerol 3-phosphate transport system ATP-binding protein